MNSRFGSISLLGRDRMLLVATTAACVFFLTLTALSLVTLDRIKYTFLESRTGLSLGVIWGLLRLSDVGLALLAAAAGLVIVWAEWQWRAMTRLFSDRSPVCLAILATSVLIFLGHAILGPGLIVTGDAGTHVARVNHLAMALRDGQSAYWDNYFFGGSTLLQFTGPIFHWTAAAVQLVVGDETQAIKYVAFLARMAAALFMYKLGRRLGLTRPVAIVAMLFYAGAYFMTYFEIIRSSFPQLVNFAAMPAILYFIEGILIAPAGFNPAVAGLALSATIFVGSHQPTALMFAVFVAIYVVVRLTMLDWPRPPLRSLLLSGIAAGLGCVYFLVPFAFERAMTADNFSAGTLIALAFPDTVMLQNMFVWGRTSSGAEYSTYFGLPMLLFALLGLWRLAARSGGGRQPLAALHLLFLTLAIFTLCVRGAYVRHAILTFFFLCVAAGLGLQIVVASFPRRNWLLVAVFALFVADAAPASVQPWTRQDLLPIRYAGEMLAVSANDQRVMEITFQNGAPVVSAGPSSTPLTAARVQILSGPHKQDATPAHNAFMAMLKVAQDDLRLDGQLGPPTQAMLAAVNVGWVVGVGDRAMGLPQGIAADKFDPMLGRYLRISGATPVLASSRVQTIVRPPTFDMGPFWNENFDGNHPDGASAKAAVLDVHRRMEIDVNNRRTERFLLKQIPNGPEWRAEDAPPPPIELVDYEVGPNRIRVAVIADRRGFLRLAHPLTPGTQISRNGIAVQAAPDVLSLAVVPIVPGVNEIVMTHSASLLRQVCFWISLFVALGLAICSIAGSRRSRLA